jgi:NADH-quinone oxidoreductase subunit D
VVNFPRQGVQGGTETMLLNVGPQHPSTHGVLHIMVELSGETVVSAKPVIGYLHRGIEKLAEGRTWQQCIVLTDRLDYVAQYSNEWAYVRAVERLAGIEVPERAEWLRTLMVELNRITSHLIWYSGVTMDIGTLGTPFIYSWVARERIFDFFESVSGGRMMPNWMRIGGVRTDIDAGALREMRDYLDTDFPKDIDDYEALLVGNEIVVSRMKGIGVLTADELVEWGVTGPALRASGLGRDLRRDDPYGAYDKLDWNVCTDEAGDSLARCNVRLAELRESAKMCVQLIDGMPGGEIATKVSRALRPPVGDVCVRTESPRGELGFLLASDGTTKPYRFRVRSPIFYNLSAMPHMLPGNLLADMLVIFGGIDTSMGEIDR